MCSSGWRWRDESEKGRWFLAQHLAASLPVTNTHALISLTRPLESGSESLSELLYTLELAAFHRLEEVQPLIEDQLGEPLNERMLKVDGHLLMMSDPCDHAFLLKDYFFNCYLGTMHGCSSQCIAHPKGLYMTHWLDC